MDTKGFALTLGLGIAAGAAAAMMIPKQSQVYQTANGLAQKLKREVSQAVSDMTDR